MFNITINIINIIINIIINKFEKKLLLLINNHRFDFKGKIKNYFVVVIMIISVIPIFLFLFLLFLLLLNLKKIIITIEKKS